MGCSCECTLAPSSLWPRLLFSPPKLCSNSLSWRPLSFPLQLQPFTHSVPTLSNSQPLRLHPTQFHYVIRTNFSFTLGNKSSGVGSSDSDSGGGGNGAGGGGYSGGGGWKWNDPFDSWGSSHSSSASQYALFLSLLLTSAFCCFCQFLLAKFAVALTTSTSTAAAASEAVWEVKGGKWTKLVPDHLNDAFVFASSGSFLGSFTRDGSAFPGILWEKCKGIFSRLMLPEGFPHSVTSDYLEYSLWRGVQGVASQVSGVLATQGLLYAVGLGKGAIPTAAAINWVLKDGIGYLSKIMLSKFGRHFDVNPKGWRLFADLLENFAFGLEILTPGCPHLFVPLGAVAGAGRSAASLIQASTRGCFYAGFAAQRNFAEVIAKGEAQGMVSKSIGIALGIALANHVSSSLPLALASFSVVTWIHMFCNLKSYQSIQLRTLNPYRASLVFSEYLLSGQAPPVKEVNNEEPLFPAIPLLNETLANKAQSTVLSSEAKNAAAEIETRLELGFKLSDVVNNKEDVLALFALYDKEGYILAEHKGKFCVVLKENCSPQDMLKGLFQVNYLYWLEKFARIEGKGPCDDCKVGGRLQISLDYAQREFDIVRNDGETVGWVMDGLISRPSSTRIRPGTMVSPGTS